MEELAEQWRWVLAWEQLLGLRKKMIGEETDANEQRPFALPFYWEQPWGLALRWRTTH